jgi:cytochrome o ubiquinol oxidase subunit 1
MMLLVILSFPVLTATLGMLTTDRLIETRIFSSTHGGNSMMYINMFWAWGHPEVYILILPAFGVFSEIVPVFCKKRLFGYTTMVWALGLIGVLSFIVWLHHFFTMGAGPNVNAFFGIMTMIIAVPTGVKVFNWLFTTYKGRIRFTTPMLWFFAFITTFTIGGMTGVLMSVPPADFQFHNSLFLIAHFHSTIIGGVVFGFFAAYTYWFPKFTGFTLDEKWGKIAFWFWFIGFLVAFLPLYALGLMGVTRRLNHYDVPEWQPLFIVAAIGAVMILIGFTAQLVQLYVSIKQRRRHQDLSGDPWDGRTLEWSTTSPPPFYNFAVTPEVTGIDAFWEQKYGKAPKPSTRYEPIHMPANTAVGFYIGAFSFTLGFAMVWYMFALAALSAVGIIACLIYRFFDTHVDYTVSVKDIETIEHAKVKL